MTLAVADGERTALLPPREHESLHRLEAEILKLPQVDMPVTHEHCDGLLARTMRIPAGTIATGAIHRHECFFLVRSGSIAVTTDDDVVLLNTGDMQVTHSGQKRAVVALTDVVLTTFHPNPSNERDPAAFWAEHVASPAMRQLGSNQ